MKKQLYMIFASLLPLCAFTDVLQFTTGDFTDSEWTTDITLDSSGTGTASTIASGGNPGAYRQIALTVAANQFVQVNQLWENTVFTPSTQGAINAVSLSYDVTRVSTTHQFATQVAKGISVRQDGVVYSVSGGVTVTALPAWDSVATPDLVALFPQINWANGNEIAFGFYDSVGTGATPFTLTGGYDNFSVTIDHQAIPEPATGILMLSSLSALAFIRNRFLI